MTRLAILLLALLFVFGFAILTADAISRDGLTLGGVLSVFILILLAVGVLGALRNPPR